MVDWLKHYNSKIKQTNKQTKKPYAKGNPTWCASAFKYCENITVEWIFTVFRSNAVTS